MTHRIRPTPPPHRPSGPADDEEPLLDPGRSLALRILALLGAFSFLMIGISSIVPLLYPAPPPQTPNQRVGEVELGRRIARLA